VGAQLLALQLDAHLAPAHDEHAVGLDLERPPANAAPIRARTALLLLLRVPDARPEPFLCDLSTSSGAEPGEAFR
jgi:hypothetical protein